MLLSSLHWECGISPSVPEAWPCRRHRFLRVDEALVVGSWHCEEEIRMLGLYYSDSNSHVALISPTRVVCVEC